MSCITQGPLKNKFSFIREIVRGKHVEHESTNLVLKVIDIFKHAPEIRGGGSTTTCEPVFVVKW